MADGTGTLKTLRPGKIFGLEILIAPSAWIGSIVIAIAAALLFAALAQLPTIEAIVAGIIGMLLYWFSEVLHQIGHAIAARRTGYPMYGVRLFTVLGASLYPRDEPALPGSTHIRRALGGPIFSFLVTLVGALLVVLIPASSSPFLNALAVFFTAINLLVFSLGAFLPLGFTDGSTILNWWGK
jgi:hypothetical protein